MDRLNGFLGPDERQHRVLGVAQTGRDIAVFAIDAVPERREQVLVELTTAGNVCDHQVDVIEFQHGLSGAAAACWGAPSS